jgi:hypothetical protein
MSLQPPNIDPRTDQELLAQTQDWVERYTGWHPNFWAEQPGAGQALIQIFVQMAALVRDRLNQAPDKNFVAFLNLIGAQILPPHAARVPLTFSLVEGSLTDSFVPARTQIVAPAPSGESDEVIFETERDLVLPTAQLQAILVRDPMRDRYANQTQVTSGFSPFTLTQDAPLIEHCLYLACDSIFPIPDSKTTTLNIISPDIAQLSSLNIEWATWNGTSWHTLSTTITIEGNQWQIEIQDFVPHALSLNSAASQVWIRAKLTQPISAIQNNIQQIQASASIQTPATLPEAGFLNAVPLDLAQDFRPFGIQPQTNDVLYLRLNPRAAEATATVTVTLKLSDPLPTPIQASNTLTIAWEVWTGETWQIVLSSQKRNSPETFTASGTFDLVLPNSIVQSSINRNTGYWLRSRIVQGNYGESNTTNTALTTLREGIDSSNRRVLKVIDTRGFKPNDTVEISAASISATGKIESLDLIQETLTLTQDLSQLYPAGTAIVRRLENRLGAPSLKSLQLSYTYTLEKTNLTTCLTYNDFVFVDCTQASQDNHHTFQPFTASLDSDPAVYLKFDSPLPNQPISLYAQVEPVPPKSLTTDSVLPNHIPKPQVIWEYASPQGWGSLGAIDETQTFAQSGLIEFIAPTDLTRRSEFGQDGYWIRARWAQGTFRAEPRLRRFCTRTTWAIQATTLIHEILGSSDSSPNQVFTTAQKPVLLGQQLEVRERTIPSDSTLAIQQAVDEIWVQWQEVPDFYRSEPSDRHYVLNHDSGQIQFGNGLQGRIPPQIRNGIRLARYQTGGGTRGNCLARTISQLKTTVPYIDQVTNLEAAAGGIDVEPLERVKERGTAQLRHRGRAIAIQDYEDLTYEATPEVARAKAIAPYLLPQPNDPRIERLDPIEHFWLDPKNSSSWDLTLHQRVNAGKLRLLIVPKSLAAQPTPSWALIDHVTSYIRARAPVGMQLEVTAPFWRKVSVTLEVVPVSLAGAEQLVTLIRDRLTQFLHPLIGSSGAGWDFGRTPHKSDFYALIGAIPNVDHITVLEISADPIPPNIPPDQFLVYSGTHTVSIRSS